MEDIFHISYKRWTRLLYKNIEIILRLHWNNTQIIQHLNKCRCFCLWTGRLGITWISVLSNLVHISIETPIKVPIGCVKKYIYWFFKFIQKYKGYRRLKVTQKSKQVVDCSDGFTTHYLRLPQSRHCDADLRQPCRPMVQNGEVVQGS